MLNAVVTSRSDRAVPGTRLCRPEKGRSLGATVTTASLPVHRAVALAADELRVAAQALPLFTFLMSREQHGCVSEPANLRLAWFLVNTAIAHAVHERRAVPAGVVESLKWFFDGHDSYSAPLLACFSATSLSAIEGQLASISIDDDFVDLLPYVLEPLGHVTRGQLEQHTEANNRRARKRLSGVFYTPSDVVEFMVAGLAKEKMNGRWLDPACGTGVFLREVVRLHATRGRVEYCKRHIYGLDLSPLSTESAAFVLLAECIKDGPLSERPFAAWSAIARNLVPTNSLLISHDHIAKRTLFPGVDGFDCIVMNPPYAAVPLPAEALAGWDSYRGLSAGDKGHLHVAFVEMMWKFCTEDGVAAAVLPLAVAASSTSQYRACRTAALRAGGRWEFLFFDREPHALFGEDIKTRNAIAFRHGSPSTELHTSRLLKWTSSLRPTIFTRARTTRLTDGDVERLIPKLGSDAEQGLYQRLKALPTSGRGIDFQLHRTKWTTVQELDHKRTIAVGSTAYNFLNAFLPEAMAQDSGHVFSQSPLHALLFDSADTRNAAFAMLSSRLFFWLWHVEGDGFHVNGEFLTKNALWRIGHSPARTLKLARLGAAVWERAAKTRLVSLNGGRATYSFHCPFDDEVVEQIDQLILDAIGAPAESMPALRTFITQTTSIDGSNRRLTQTRTQKSEHKQ